MLKIIPILQITDLLKQGQQLCGSKLKVSRSNLQHRGDRFLLRHAGAVDDVGEHMSQCRIGDFIEEGETREEVLEV